MASTRSTWLPSSSSTNHLNRRPQRDIHDAHRPSTDHLKGRPTARGEASFGHCHVVQREVPLVKHDRRSVSARGAREAMSKSISGDAECRRGRETPVASI
jgi:hypothetical protein